MLYLIAICCHLFTDPAVNLPGPSGELPDFTRTLLEDYATQSQRWRLAKLPPPERKGQSGSAIARRIEAEKAAERRERQQLEIDGVVFPQCKLDVDRAKTGDIGAVQYKFRISQILESRVVGQIGQVRVAVTGLDVSGLTDDDVIWLPILVCDGPKTYDTVAGGTERILSLSVFPAKELREWEAARVAVYRERKAENKKATSKPVKPK